MAGLDRQTIEKSLLAAGASKVVTHDGTKVLLLSPARVFVNGLRSESDLFDVIDLSLQGSAYCVNVRGRLLAAPNSGQIFAASLPSRSVIMQPDLPSPEMQKADKGFAGNLFANLGPGCRAGRLTRRSFPAQAKSSVKEKWGQRLAGNQGRFWYR